MTNANRSPASAPTPDLNLSSVPRYVQLAGLFRRRIESGQWRLGNQIPTVDDLAAECGVARATIRQALGMLEADGLIERLRAKGTFVKRAPQDQIWCEVHTDWSGLLMSRDGATIEVLDDVDNVAAPPVSADIGALAPAYRHLRRRHSRHDQPFLLADVYIETSVAQRIPKAAFRTKTAMRLITDVPGVEIIDARQTLTIGTADINMAQQLKVPLNDPVAFVRRCAVAADGVVVLIADGVYRGDIVRLDIRLK